MIRYDARHQLRKVFVFQLTCWCAIYDMYFGEGFCGALPEYDYIYPEILKYAYKELKDDCGMGIAICDDNSREIETAVKCGFAVENQTETIMTKELDKTLSVEFTGRSS